MLRRVLSREGLHKLSPMWEGPFKVVHVSRPGSARLETQEGVPVQNTWNIQHLRRFDPTKGPVPVKLVVPRKVSVPVKKANACEARRP